MQGECPLPVHSQFTFRKPKNIWERDTKNQKQKNRYEKTDYETAGSRHAR